MTIYVISGLALLLCVYILSLCVQLIGMEKSITKISYIVEHKVARLYKSAE